MAAVADDIEKPACDLIAIRGVSDEVVALASIAISLKRIADVAEAWQGGVVISGDVDASTPVPRRTSKPTAQEIERARANGTDLIVEGHCYACEKSAGDCNCLPF